MKIDKKQLHKLIKSLETKQRSNPKFKGSEYIGITFLKELKEALDNGYRLVPPPLEDDALSTFEDSEEIADQLVFIAEDLNASEAYYLKEAATHIIGLYDMATSINEELGKLRHL